MSIFISLDVEVHVVGFDGLAIGVVYLSLVTKEFHAPVPQMELG
jgi:hypothetical protein